MQGTFNNRCDVKKEDATGGGSEPILSGNNAYNGGTLNLDFGDQKPEAGTHYTLIDASTLSGSFDQVISDSVDVELEYTGGAIVATVL